jgi:hypothetical protein
MAQQDDFIRTALRVPPALHKSLHSAATAANRTFNAEIIARLQTSFEPVVQNSEIEAIVAERDQQRALAEQFRSIADSTESLRALLAAMLLRAFEKMRTHGVPVDTDVWLQETFMRWLTEKDVRGAAFSILRLIDESSPEVVETLRNFASHLEDVDMVRKPITLVKGKSNQKKTQKRDSSSVDKSLMLGTFGSETNINFLPARPILMKTTPVAPNKGPVPRTRNKPPK